MFIRDWQSTGTVVSNLALLRHRLGVLCRNGLIASIELLVPMTIGCILFTCPVPDDPDDDKLDKCERRLAFELLFDKL